jgi:hypothetical protein
MELLLIGFMVLLNVAIASWNAYACGKAWAETKAVGGWRRFVTWMAAAMSAIGFSWCLLIMLALSSVYFGVLPLWAVEMSLAVGYLLIIPVLLFAGLMITIDSWATAFQRGGVLNYGVAVYNTYAQVHNAYHAIEGVGQAFSSIGKGLGELASDEDGAKLVFFLIAIGLVFIAITGGIVITTVIIRKVAAADELRTEDELRRLQAQRG